MITKGELVVDSSGVLDETCLLEQLPSINKEVFGFYHDGYEYWLDESLYLKHNDFVQKIDNSIGVKNKR